MMLWWKLQCELSLGKRKSLEVQVGLWIVDGWAGFTWWRKQPPWTSGSRAEEKKGLTGRRYRRAILRRKLELMEKVMKWLEAKFTDPCLSLCQILCLPQLAQVTPPDLQQLLSTYTLTQNS